MDLKEVKNILNEKNIYAKKQFGQNFLIDSNVLNKIVNSTIIDSETCVVEIGPGMGALTELLLKKANKVICYEIDKDMIEILEKRFNNELEDKLTIINKDFLKANINKDLKEYKKIKVVANLPYYITTPILIKILEEAENVEEMIVMMQKEVAERICGKPSTKDYNSLSVLIQYKHTATLLFDVSKGCFYPEPEVTSSIVKIKKSEPKIKPIDEKFFYSFNRNIFKQRRKTLVNNIKTSYKIDKNIIDHILSDLELSKSVRSEELKVDKIIELSDKFFAALKSN